MENKKKVWLYVTGCAVAGIAALLVIYSMLVALGVVHLRQNKLIFYGLDAEKVYDGEPLTEEGWEMTSGKLQSGHVAKVSTVGSITEPGVAENRISVIILDENGGDVTAEYDIVCVAGKLTVKGLPITVASHGASKLYDGKPLKEPACYLAEGSLLAGHELDAEAVSSLTDVGIIANEFSVRIIDSKSGNDITHFYDITHKNGELEVFRRTLTLSTASDGKTYDGVALQNGNFSLVGDLMPGHRGEVNVLGSIINVGSVVNNATLKIIDRDGNDVTSMYQVTMDFGLLTVTPSLDDGNDGNGGGGGGGGNSEGEGEGEGEGSGGGSSSDGGLNSKDQSPDFDCFIFTSQYTGKHLFRIKHSGDYDYDRWKPAPENEDESGLYLVSNALGASGKGRFSADVKLLANIGYLTPYYVEKATVNPTLTQYNISFYAYEYGAEQAPTLSKELAEFELEYRKYVYETYLTLPETTKSDILKIFHEAAKENGIDTDKASVSELVLFIESYIKGAAEYNMDFPEYPQGCDTAVYFLKEAKSGVCRHFATSAVAMYRAIGIPARYTEGFSANAVAGEEYTITSERAHAWVEVYIDGLGWINVDPTGGSNGSGGGGEGGGGEGGGGEGGDSDGEAPDHITVTSESVEKPYDGKTLTSNLHTVEGLPEGFTYDISFTGSQTEPGSSANSFTVKIYDKDGNDITSDVVVIKNEGILKVDPIKLGIISASSQKNYNGKPLTDARYALDGAVLADHTVKVNCFGSITDPGTVKNEFEFTITDGEGNDVSGFYDITCVEGELKVLPLLLKIKPLDAEKVYDGTPLMADKYVIISGGFLPGHTPVVTYIGSRTEPGVSNSSLSCRVEDRDGEDVTDKYNITYETGILKVDPAIENAKALTVTSDSASKVYDGTPLEAAVCRYDATKLMDGHILEYTVTGSQTDAGSSKNTFEVVIKDAEGNDVTGSYEIIKREGTLTVKKRNITVFTSGAVKTYDGTPLTNGDYVIEGEIAADQTAEITVTGSQTAVGESENTFECVIKDASGNDVTENYEVTKKIGALVVEKALMKVTTDSAKKLYDGTPLRKDGATVEWDELAGHTLDVKVTGFRLEPGVSDNTAEVAVFNSNGDDVTEYFEIEYVFGELTVLTTKLTFISGSGEKVYDGTPLTVKDDPEMSGGLPDGYRVEFEILGSQTNVGMGENTFNVKVFDENGVDVTESLTIKTVYGKLNVTPITLVVRSESGEKEYDGKPLIVDEWDVIGGKPVDGHTVHAEITGSQKEVGESKNTFNVTVLDEDGNDVSENYYFSTRFGTLKVNKVALEITSVGAVKVYDGTPLVPEKYTIVGNLGEGHKEEITFTASITDVGTCKATFTVKILDSEGNDVKKNYDIITNVGMLEILPIKLTVTTESATKEYDGTPLTAPGWEITAGELPKDHEITVNVTGSQTNFGKANNVFSYVINDASGKNVTANYQITKKEGVLEVTKKEIIIITESATKEYDGTPLKASGWEFEKGEILKEHNFVIKILGSQTEIGESYNNCTTTITDKNGRNVKLNYSILYKYGKLVVTAPKVYEDTDVSNDPFDIQDIDMFKYVANTNGKILFLENVYGSYTYSGWTAIPKGETDQTSLSLAASVMGASGMQNKNVQITNINYGVEARPSYSASLTGDKYPDGRYGYSFYQYTYTLASNVPGISSGGSGFGGGLGGSGSIGGNNLSSLEQEYRSFVYKNYTSLPTDTKNVILGIVEDAAAKDNFDYLKADRKTLVAWVENYIQNAVPYNLNFKPFPKDADIAVYFLTEATGGICQHFATAATCMLRALGIPARYATGYSSIATANQDVLVKAENAHAWVEVYVDGLGWVNIDPTGGTGGDSSDEEEPKDYLYEITVKSDSATRVYNGKDYVTAKGYEVVNGKLQEGHRIIATYIGKQLYAGTSENKWTVDRIVDENGNDVTDLYKVNKEYGSLTVTPLKVVIHPLDKQFEYSGEEYIPGNDYGDQKGWQKLFDENGDAIIIYDSIVPVYEGSITDIGTVEISITSVSAVRYDKNNRAYDMTKNYEFDISAKGSITVVPKAITITSGSCSKLYDGKPIKYEQYTVTDAKNAILEGHTMNLVFKEAGSEIHEYYNEFTVSIVDSEGKDVTRNYAINAVYGKLIVAYAHLEFYTESLTVTYDGQSHSAKQTCDFLSEDRLKSGHVLKSAVLEVALTEPGTAKNKPTVTILDESGEDVSWMYLISEEQLGTITVQKAKLTVTSASETIKYDPNYPEKVLQNKNYECEGLVNGQSVKVVISGSIEGIGVCDNQIDDVKVYTADGKDVTHCYDITLVNGILFIKP